MNFKKYLILFVVLIELIFLVNIALNYISCFDIIAGKNVCLVLKVTEVLSFFLLCFSIFKIINSKQRKPSETHYKFGEIILYGLLANYKVIHVYCSNVPEFGFVFFIYALSAGLAIFLLLFYLLKVLFKNEQRGLFISLCFNIMLYCIEFKSVTTTGTLLDFALVDIWAAFTILGVIVLLPFIFNMDKLFKFLKNLIVILLIFSAISALFKYAIFCKQTYSGIERQTAFVPAKKYDRDIYIILLDMYSGEKTLNKLGFDNTNFYEELQGRGFSVYPDISSNYNKTLGTLVSIFNFNYYDKVPYDNVTEAVDKSLMFYLARESGYKVYYLNSELSGLKQNPKYYYKLYSDMDAMYNNSFSCLYSGSMFYNLRKYFSPIFTGGKEDFIAKTLEDNKNKKFVFFHLMMPHWPYYFDENGNEINGSFDRINPDGSRELNKDSYISYLKYTNKYILNLADKIISLKEKEPVIILFGDHGIRRKYYFRDEQKHIDKLKNEPNVIEDQFNTFLAYYNPDEKLVKKDYKSLVNFYRDFSNKIFGTTYPELENKRFFFYYNTLNGLWLH